MSTRVYIAGPMSKGDRVANLAQALTAMRELMARGFAPLCPQLSFFAEPFIPADYDGWLAIDLPWVRVAEAVLRLPGESGGADKEVHEALNRDIPVFANLEDLCAFYGR